MTSPNKWAIIIGIDVYFRRDGGKVCAGDLHGCVADAENTYNYLRGSPFNIPIGNITLLTSSHKDFPCPPGTDNMNMSQFPPKDSTLARNLATYKNIMEGLKKVLESSQPGDLVYFHFSGHGARVTTPEPLQDWLGKSAHVDEALVPADIDVDKGSYRGLFIRDWELAYVFGAMVEKGLKLTVVIDSCHSGGATRGPDRIDDDISAGDPANMPRVRGLAGMIQPRERDMHPLFPIPDIKIAWQKLQAQSTVRKAWLMQPFQYNIITACLPHELSHELLQQGVLSKAVIDSLKQIDELGKPVTYQMLFRNLYNRCYGWTYGDEVPQDVQTPVILGDANKIFFSPDDTTLEHIASIPVHALPRCVWVQKMSVSAGHQKIWRESELTDREEPKLILRAGEVHGVRRGEIYGIYEWTASAVDMRDPAQAIGQLAVVEVKKVVSVLGLIQGEGVDNTRLSNVPWKTGRQAILLHGPADDAETKQIYLSGSTTFSELQSTSADVKYFKGPVPLAFSANPSKTDYQIAEEDGKFWLRDADGKRIPKVPGCKGHQLASMLQYLTQICRYKERLALQTEETNEYTLEDTGTGINSEGKEEITLKFENMNTITVNFVVYHFTPNWGIHKIYPLDADFESMDCNDSRTFSLQRDPSEGDFPEGTDYVKIFIMNGSTSFSTWEMADIPLDENRGAESGHADAILQLLSSSPPVAVDAKPSRYLYDDFDVAEEVPQEVSGAVKTNETKLNKCWSKKLLIRHSKQ